MRGPHLVVPVADEKTIQKTLVKEHPRRVTDTTV